MLKRKDERQTACYGIEKELKAKYNIENLQIEKDGGYKSKLLISKH